MIRPPLAPVVAVLLAMFTDGMTPKASTQTIVPERSVAQHLADGSEYNRPLPALLTHCKLLFDANWTEQEGTGHPSPTLSPPPQRRAFNRISAPDEDR